MIGQSRRPSAASPSPRRSARAAFPAGWTAVDGITPFRTSSTDFYRVDTRLSLPDRRHRLLVADDRRRRGERSVLSFDDLLAMPLIERDITLTCVSNNVGGPYIGGARWLGVGSPTCSTGPGSARKADQILSTDVDGMTISTPLALATDGRDAMIAVGMNGEPAAPRPRLPGPDGGARPLRVHQRLQVDHPDDADDLRRPHGVLDRPRLGHRRPDQGREPDRHPAALCSAIKAGDTFIGGVAWAQPAGSRRSRCRSTAGRGSGRRSGRAPATTTGASGICAWDAKPGQHQLACRATDRDGRRADDRPRLAVPGRRRGISRPSSRSLDEPDHPSGQARRFRTPAMTATQDRKGTMNTTLRRTGIAAIALGGPLGLAACGGNDSSSSRGTGDRQSRQRGRPDLRLRLRRRPDDRCRLVRRDGRRAGASAASANPVLSTLVTAVTRPASSTP